MSHGDPTMFLTRAISLAFMIVTALILIVMALQALRKRRGDITS